MDELEPDLATKPGTLGTDACTPTQRAAPRRRHARRGQLPVADGSHQPDDGLLEGAPRPNPRGALQKGLLALLSLSLAWNVECVLGY